MQTFLTDSHVHFDSFEESGELYDVLNRAWSAGVHRMIAVGGSPGANTLAMLLAQEHAHSVRAVVGYDRDLAGRDPSLSDLEAQAENPCVVGIGETGLDYHYLPETAPAQRELLGQMLEIARHRALPAVIHSREADEDTLAMLRAHAAQWTGEASRIGVLHCFTGSIAFARQLIDMGLMISFSGIVTFKNADALREVALFVPEDRLLIETDAPYLAPAPLRGKRNEPAFITHVAGTLATVRKVPLQHIAQQTTRNANRLFGLGEEGTP
ncbi:MAG: TatD family hydrolase [bacterium]